MTDQLRSIYSRWQNLEADKAAISEDLKELFAEAKSNGYDPKALRIAFRLKAAAEGPKAHEVAETASLVEVYVAALGGEEVVIPSRERARVPREDRATQIGTHADSGEVLSLVASRQKIRSALGLTPVSPDEGGG